MNRSKLMNALTGHDEKLLFSKVLEQALICEKKGFPTFSDFLDPVKTEKFKALIERENIAGVCTFGGAFGCERQMLGFFYHEVIGEQEFPISVIEIIHNSEKLTHRDFLGSILGAGIDRSKVGDIFIFEEKAMAFLCSEISHYVCGSLDKVANVKVSANIVEDDFLLAPFQDLKVKDIIVPSLRLDAVVSGIFNISRGMSAKLIEKEKAFINWASVKSSSKSVSQGDMITLRGEGRAKIKSVNGQTKKGNISLTVEIYGK